jgi:hypothetical protein
MSKVTLTPKGMRTLLGAIGQPRSIAYEYFYDGAGKVQEVQATLYPCGKILGKPIKGSALVDPKKKILNDRLGMEVRAFMDAGRKFLQSSGIINEQGEIDVED